MVYIYNLFRYSLTILSIDTMYRYYLYIVSIDSICTPARPPDPKKRRRPKPKL